MRVASPDRRPPRELTGRTVLLYLVAFFLVVAGVNGIMIRAAISTFGGVETASSYQAGLAFKREAAAARRQDSLRWRVKAAVASLGGTATRVEVTARDPADRPLGGLGIVVRLTHPLDARADHVVTLTEEAPGRFVGATDAVIGQWDLVVELSRDGERMFRSRNRVVVH